MNIHFGNKAVDGMEVELGMSPSDFMCWCEQIQEGGHFNCWRIKDGVASRVTFEHVVGACFLGYMENSTWDEFKVYLNYLTVVRIS